MSLRYNLLLEIRRSLASVLNPVFRFISFRLDPGPFRPSRKRFPKWGKRRSKDPGIVCVYLARLNRLSWLCPRLRDTGRGATGQGE